MDENTRLRPTSLASEHDTEFQKQKLISWRSMLDATLQQHTLETIALLAERLREPEHILAHIEQAKSQAKMGFYWATSSFSRGFGSLILPYLYLARIFPDQGWGDVAQRYARLTAEATHQQPLQHIGVFNGISGLATSIDLLSQDQPRYQKTRQRLENSVALQTLRYTWKRQPNDTGVVGVADYDYDAISGAAGVLGYLISCESPEPATQDAIQKLLEYLVWLGSNDDDTDHKRWYIPLEFIKTKEYFQLYPEGYFNLGLSHGIPGPLAALSLAWLAGYRVEGQQEAIRAISQWIVQQQIHDPWGINWPHGVPRQTSPSTNTQIASRTAWCYGAPGIARALWLAGTALEDKTLCQTAIDAIEAVLRHPPEKRGIYSPTICHGVSGLLLICLRFAHEMDNTLLYQHIPLLTQQILDDCNSEYPFGVRDEELSGNFVDDPGFLTGAAGVLLTLLAAATPIAPSWDRTLLIA